ncbi:MAG: hypothetical protein KDA22_03570 [Phycisphaerales bacterium]|nr:hypothetical protein [Phycisphaerales bacterium]
MDLPAYQVPFVGNGIVIAITATVHVLISHGLAIGLVAMIVLAEFVAERRRSAEWRAFARDLTKFAVVVITGVGAVTGVGIWFVTSAISPRAIGSLLRIFFWPWTIEWIVFIAELVILLVYYFTWDAMGCAAEAPRRRRHRLLGIGYLALTVLGAALITGILGFMLTPASWPQDRQFWSAFLNQSYVPQLVLRLLVSVHLGALVAACAALLYRRSRELGRQAMPIFGGIALVSLILLAPTVAWYFSRVPSGARAESVSSVLTSRLAQAPGSFWIANATATGAILLCCAALLLRRHRTAMALSPVALLMAIALTAEFERIREFIRGPCLVPGYMYANQALLAELPLRRQRGLLEGDAWRRVRETIPAELLGTRAESDRAAAFLFGQNCAACHTIGGVNDITTRLAGRSQDGILVILGHAHEMVPFMPPFVGTEEERRLVAGFLHRLTAGEVEMASLSRFVPEAAP